MENNWKTEQTAGSNQTIILANNFVPKVMSLMTVGLIVSGILAYLFGTSEELFYMLINPETGSRKALGWVVMLAPLGMVLLLGSGLRRFSASTMTLLFIVFSALMGMSISYIFVAYSLGSITSTFFISATMFGVMALVGYTTKTDLSKLGSLLFMGLIGIIIASIINYFLGSATFDYIISFIGVLIFTGLTAYDMQKVKQIGMQLDSESEEGKKAAIMGALSLYLDFINLFLFLLRFFGNRD
jgi:FtsH-binding integral membrane protein